MFSFEEGKSAYGSLFVHGAKTREETLRVTWMKVTAAHARMVELLA